MPLLSYGKFTVHSGGSDSAFIKNAPAEFTFYSPVPIFGLLALLSCVLAIRFHKILDPAYSTAKVWALVPAYAGLVVVFCLSGDQSIFLAYPPFMVTIVLLIWRWLKPVRILSAFMYATAAVFFMNFLFLFALTEDFAPLLLLIVINMLYAGFIVIPICAIRAFVQRRVTWMRFFWGYFFGTVLPLIPLYLFVALSGASSSSVLYPLGFISLSTVPLIVLIRWNSWVRDVVTGAMFLSPKTTE